MQWLVVAMVLLVAGSVGATTVDIFNVGDSGSINGAVFAGDSQHVGGTGAFSPFLSLHDSPIERAYNAGNGNLYMDNQRPAWNQQLHIGDLAMVDLLGTDYYLFVLDANEPGNDKSFISIDNIRIYTSASDTSLTVQGDEGSINSLGTLRYSMNDPLKVSDDYNIANWVNLDSRLDAEPAGSGLYDMYAYIPVSAFAGAAVTDYVWFYNLNGVHYEANGDLASTAGFEEWRALTGHRVPDAGATLVLLGLSLLAIGRLRRRA
jgi:hypothetical protein